MVTRKRIEVKRDPDNPNTVILSRYPTEEEKTEEFRQRVRDTRKGK